MTSNSFSSSAPPSTAEGSSRMTSRALRDRALAISTICRCATLRLSSRAPGSTLKPSRAMTSEAAALRRAPVDEAEAVRRQAAEEQIFGDRQMRRQHHLLIDDRDAELEHPLRRRPGDLFAVDRDLAGIGLVGAGKDLHQRRFAGAVLADQPVHLAAADMRDRRREARRRRESACRCRASRESAQFGSSMPGPPSNIPQNGSRSSLSFYMIN